MKRAFVCGVAICWALCSLARAETPLDIYVECRGDMVMSALIESYVSKELRSHDGVNVVEKERAFIVIDILVKAPQRSDYFIASAVTMEVLPRFVIEQIYPPEYVELQDGMARIVDRMLTIGKRSHAEQYAKELVAIVDTRVFKKIRE